MRSRRFRLLVVVCAAPPVRMRAHNVFAYSVLGHRHEAEVLQSWRQWVGRRGGVVGIDRFGASAPGGTLVGGGAPAVVPGAAVRLHVDPA